MAKATVTRAGVGAAVLASEAGTIAFGVLMTVMGMMPMVAALVGSDSTPVGWVVHLVIGGVLGVAYGVIQPFVRLHPVLTGLGYGVALWIGGGLVAMPLRLGMPEMVLNLSGATPWYSLMGHLVYGAVTGAVFARFAPEAASATARGTQA